MKIIVMLLILSIIGCSSPAKQVKTSPIESSIIKQENGSFKLVLSREKLNKVNKGLECLKVNCVESKIVKKEYGNMALVFAVSILVGFSGGFYLGSR